VANGAQQITTSWKQMGRTQSRSGMASVIVVRFTLRWQIEHQIGGCTFASRR
jgi:hypothetical protein